MRMSVIMGLRIEVDPERLKQAMDENEQGLMAIVEQSKQRGAIHHAFYAGDGAVMVVDEWPDEESFLGFFEAQGAEIGQLMSSAGVTSQPQPTFWRLMDTPDRF
jgi:hypothetical protein